MRSRHIVLAAALSAGLASTAWCADEPASPTAAPAAQSTPAAQPAPAQPTAAESSAASDAAAKAAKEKAAASKDAADAEEKHLLARGYKKETRSNGQVVYCRKEIKTGSLFETKQCGTAESMAYQEEQARQLMHNSMNAQGSKVN